MTTEVDRLTAGKYVRVTTFRKSGTPVSTPVWVVRQGDNVVIWTGVHTGKFKRIRNNAAVELSACDFRGNPSGAVVKGSARILDEEGSKRIRRMIMKKYGLFGRTMALGSIIRRGQKGDAGIAITLSE
jgi:PPOX class probable F420-dependent enzyme